MEPSSPLPGRRVIRTLVGNGHLAVQGKEARAVLYNIEVSVPRIADSTGVVLEGPPTAVAFLALLNQHGFAEYVGDEATLILEDPDICPWACFARNAVGRFEHRGDGPLPGTRRDGRQPWS